MWRVNPPGTIIILYFESKIRCVKTDTKHEQSGQITWIGGGGYLVQKTLQRCAANMGSKINLLVYEWPLIRCKIWYMNGSIFPNLSQNWLKFKKILEKICNFVHGIWMSYFFLKNWYLYGSTFKFCGGTYPYQNQTWVPPGTWIW